MKAATKHLLAVTAIVIALPGAAPAVCDIGGRITATPNADPMGPVWKYTAVINWDTGSQNVLSHMGLWLDIAGGTCACADFQQAISFDAIIGRSGTTCPVDYSPELNCQGDPSIPGDNGIVLKLEPNEEICEAGTVGQGTFVFYSDLGPAAIDEDALTLVDKFGRNHCFGSLASDFPSMPCNPVSAAHSSWGEVKGMFR